MTAKASENGYLSDERQIYQCPYNRRTTLGVSILYILHGSSNELLTSVYFRPITAFPGLTDPRTTLSGYVNCSMTPSYDI